MQNLVIVESPTKAKTISRFLGKEFQVESSFGHIRDLPKSKIGVDIENGFEPDYVVPKDKAKRVTELRKLAKNADKIYFATDEDREGEAISWHLQELFKSPEDKNIRIVFHEITKEAIEESLKNPRKLDLNLVNAQQARRVLDRLVGYELSPLLWKKIARGLSAGRVQSVAVRLLVEREREIEAFDPQEYWSIVAEFETDKGHYEAKLAKIDGKTLDKLAIEDEAQATKILSELKEANFTISDVITKDTKRNPYPPFTTSTLQQAANSMLGFSAKQTMMVAQQLYEGIKIGSEGEVGLITYMRTDSVSLAEKFKTEAKHFITDKYGANFAHPRNFKTKSKNAQEAHEAIRPTSASRDPESIKQHLDAKQYKLYNLIWQRSVASQMEAAKLKQTTIETSALAYTFKTNGSIVDFPGWLQVYPADKVTETILPAVAKNDAATAKTITPNQHFTQPPSRYSEASLVKALEEKGIGRPSTYAPTITTIQTRNYVIKEGNALKPTDVGKVVTDLLTEHFPEIVDYEFTAKVEDEFDDIANGELEWHDMIKKFYQPFHALLEQKEETIQREDVVGMREVGTDPESGKPIYARVGRYGPFVQKGSKDDEEKPTFAPLKKEQSIETITLEEALELFSLPRTVGTTEDGEEIIAAIGRFGPFLKYGTTFVSIKNDDPYTIEEERAREAIREHAKRMAEKLIKDFPDSKIRIEKGRWGPMIREGRTRTRVPKELEAEKLSLEDCEKLLAEAKEKKKQKS